MFCKSQNVILTCFWNEKCCHNSHTLRARRSKSIYRTCSRRWIWRIGVSSRKWIAVFLLSCKKKTLFSYPWSFKDHTYNICRYQGKTSDLFHLQIKAWRLKHLSFRKTSSKMLRKLSADKNSISNQNNLALKEHPFPTFWNKNSTTDVQSYLEYC